MYIQYVYSICGCRERDIARRDISSLDSQDSPLDFTFGSLQEFREYKESQRQAKQQQQQQPAASMQEEADSQRRASSSRASSTGNRSNGSSNNGNSRGGNRGRSSRKDYETG